MYENKTLKNPKGTTIIADLNPPSKKTTKEDVVVQKLGTVLFCSCLIIALVSMSVGGGLKWHEMSKTIKAQELEMQIRDANVESLRERLFIISKTASDLKEKLSNLKNKEDLSRRDLEAYIVKKFRVIPQVVAHEVAAQVVKLTKERGVPFSLIVGLIEVESQFKPWAVSKKDARGLMQVMPFWVKKKKEIGMDLKSKYDLHDIGINVAAGIQVFKYHLKEANNDINQGLYLYVGKDRTYANKVFNAMGRFEVFRSTLDTTLRDEENKELSENKTAPKKSDRFVIN